MLQTLSDKWIDRLLWVAIVASLIGALADVLLLYNPLGGYEVGTYEFLIPITKSRLMLGHYLGIIFIPLELLGLFFIYRGLYKGNEKAAFLLVLSTIYAVFPGVVYHGTCAMTASLLQLGTADAELFNYWKLLFEPLGALLGIGLFLMSGLLFYIIRFKNTRFAMWLAFANPLSFYIVFVLFYFLLPVIGNFLIPAGFNLSFCLFFICAKVAYRGGR